MGAVSVFKHWSSWASIHYIKPHHQGWASTPLSISVRPTKSSVFILRMSGTNQKLLIIGLKLICVDQRSLYVLCNRRPADDMWRRRRSGRKGGTNNVGCKAIKAPVNVDWVSLRSRRKGGRGAAVRIYKSTCIFEVNMRIIRRMDVWAHGEHVYSFDCENDGWERNKVAEDRSRQVWFW